MPEHEPERASETEPDPMAEDLTPTQAIRTAPLPILESIEPRQVLGEAELHDEPPTQSFEVPTLSPEVAVPERRRPPRPERLPEAPLPPAPLVVSDPLADTMVERQKRKGPAETVPRQQRIVAVRLIAKGDQRIDGATLKAALQAERLAFGRYSIFHRLLESDRPIYSVASLVEPGSFDPDVMGSEQFPGISLFAVFPGPLPAPQAFDELLATARRLADKLGGVLQDDSGSSLTGQRVLSLREELVHFEHIVGLGARGRPAG
jgi:cell division protein ZipA